MIYFYYGVSPNLEIQVEKIINEIYSKYDNIPEKTFDCTLKEEEDFFASIQSNSIFKTTEFLILKRCEVLKSTGIQKIFKQLKNYNLDEKIILMIYNVPIVYEKLSPDYELASATIKLIEEIATFHNFSEIKGNNNVLEYVKSQIKISDKDAKNLSELLGKDFYHIKNEIEKIVTFLDGEDYSFEKIKNIISLDKEYNLKELIENFLKTKDYMDLIEFLENNKDSYMGFIYLLADELITSLKIASLIKDGKISKNMNYNVFKDLYNNFSDYFMKNNRVQHPYVIFLKVNSFENFSENFLLKKISNLLEIEYFMKSGEKDINIEIATFLSTFFKEI